MSPPFVYCLRRVLTLSQIVQGVHPPRNIHWVRQHQLIALLQNIYSYECPMETHHQRRAKYRANSTISLELPLAPPFREFIDRDAVSRSHWTVLLVSTFKTLVMSYRSISWVKSFDYAGGKRTPHDFDKIYINKTTSTTIINGYTDDHGAPKSTDLS